MVLGKPSGLQVRIHFFSSLFEISVITLLYHLEILVGNAKNTRDELCNQVELNSALASNQV